MHGITGNVPPGSLPVKAVYGRVDLPRMKTLFEIPVGLQRAPFVFGESFVMLIQHLSADDGRLAFQVSR